MNDMIIIVQYEHERENMWYYKYPSTEKVINFAYFLHSIGLHELQPPMIKPQGDPYDQFFYFTHGSGTLILNGKKMNLPQHSAFFVPAGVPHEYYPSEDVWDVRWMVPRGEGLPMLYKALGIEEGGVFPLKDVAPLDIILNKMHMELIQDAVNGNLYASACVGEFIAEFARQAGILSEQESVSEEKKHVYHTYMIQLEDYINYHYMHTITLSELCELIGVTPQHLCRIFKKCTGMRPMEYITNTRIEAAKRLLRESGYSINTIAGWCGFENDNYFWKTFKKLVGRTPKKYREEYSINL